MVTCIGSDLVAIGCLFFEASVACTILKAMSGCLEFSVSCIGVGPGGSCWRKECSKVCHLGEMRVDCELCLVSLFTSDCRCSGEVD